MGQGKIYGARRYETSWAEWKRIEGLFPAAKTGRPAKWGNRTTLNAILWLARSGAAWQDMPPRHPPRQGVYSRFCKWRDEGTLKKVFRALGAGANFANMSIDSTTVKVRPQGCAIKRGRRTSASG